MKEVVVRCAEGGGGGGGGLGGRRSVSGGTRKEGKVGIGGRADVSGRAPSRRHRRSGRIIASGHCFGFFGGFHGGIVTAHINPAGWPPDSCRSREQEAAMQVGRRLAEEAEAAVAVAVVAVDDGEGEVEKGGLS